MRTYFYTLQRKYLSLFILAQNSVVEIDPTTPLSIAAMPQGRVAFRNVNGRVQPNSEFDRGLILSVKDVLKMQPDYLVANGLIHFEKDIQKLLATLRGMCRDETRLVLTSYSSLWRPLVRIASAVGLRTKAPELNWLAPEDIENLLSLENFELVRLDRKVLIPLYIPLVSNFINRYVASLPVFKKLCLLNIIIAKPVRAKEEAATPSVSIVVPARNESGNIDAILERIPVMGPDDEIIFVEGNSTDDTWRVIQAAQHRYRESRRILISQQEGRGKGDAVRKGFGLATKEILMILDADMTVEPEDLPKFYGAIKDGKGELINGARLVYPMERKAMRFFNLLGNKFFAMAFSYVLGQRCKDTLCGTKVISRANYQKLAANRSYFGEFDPFGDFDLLFGAARMGLKIVGVPICYRQRVYGKTNVSRWRHGAILLAMLIFAARKIKFL
ncbi:glycosyltransferase family 2 protein [Bradyrhizobium ivorense]|uniref:glycosyltransferase family 2 protein n=1 Tax=Bradyrhizobium ivorense TaxID=2511166 RepID=UPI0010BB9872|nr:glycosyltransferase family 2 protein [Bradyrhizobium ivorense]VIO69838.1 putative glycosyltransferase [Bradyrhizobium ivorense]